MGANLNHVLCPDEFEGRRTNHFTNPLRKKIEPTRPSVLHGCDPARRLKFRRHELPAPVRFVWHLKSGAAYADSGLWQPKKPEKLSRISYPASRVTHHVSRITFLASRIPRHTKLNSRQFAKFVSQNLRAFVSSLFNHRFPIRENP